MRLVRLAIVWAALAVSVGLPCSASAAEAIRIGELSSYSRWAAFTVPYRQGWQLAVEEINAAGGALGRPLEVISRDDNATTGDAVRVAEELVTRERAVFLFGTFLSNVGLAVADFANQRKLVFVATEPLTDSITMEQGNPYTFRLRPSTYTQTAMLVAEAQSFGAERWAIVAPNYEYGQSAAAVFKQLLAERLPNAQVVVEQYPALGKIDAGATVAAIARARPDAIFNVTFGTDLGKLVREGTTRGLFENRPVLSLLTGEPEWLDPLRDEAPEGWIVTGYPWSQIDTPEHRSFRTAYEKKYRDYPRLGSLLGYTTGYLIKAMLEKAGSTETEALRAALEGLEVTSPAGPIRIRAIDNQSTLGAWVGRTTVVDGKGTLKDWRYVDATPFLPSEEAVRRARGDR